MKSPRRPELDGLRGIAATMVLLSHCLQAVGAPGELQGRLVKGLPGALGNGNSAVVLFFVLSGVVLTESLLRDESPPGVRRFYLRRALRIWPAYTAALLFAWIVTAWTSEAAIGDGASHWLRSVAQVHLSVPWLLLCLLVPGPSFQQLPQGWTLIIELAMSLLLPGLLFVASRAGTAAVLAAAALGLFVASNPVWSFSLPFVLGVALVLRRDAVGARVASLSPATTAALLGAAAAAFFLPPYILWARSLPLGMSVTCAGAAGVLLLAPRTKTVGSLLRSAPLEGLGRISYSLYLLHLPVLLAVAPFVLGDSAANDATTVVARWLLLAAVVAAISVPAAALSWKVVEEPGIGAGRRLAQRIRAR